MHHGQPDTARSWANTSKNHLPLDLTYSKAYNKLRAASPLSRTVKGFLSTSLSAIKKLIQSLTDFCDEIFGNRYPLQQQLLVFA